MCIKIFNSIYFIVLFYYRIVIRFIFWCANFHFPLHLFKSVRKYLKFLYSVLFLNRYYEIDDIVVREFLGKKLSSKHRKDLDEVSEKTSIAIKSCRFVFLIISFKVSFQVLNNYIIMILDVNLIM